LSYPNFFDWPKTIEQTLQKEPDIRVLVVFLGPNDPWDFPMGKKYLKFASPEWEAEYLNRVRRILDAASAHDVQVIWLGIPYMKKAKLNEQMRYLDKILSGTVSPQAIYRQTVEQWRRRICRLCQSRWKNHPLPQQGRHSLFRRRPKTIGRKNYGKN